jgi:acetyl-CoA carboxylase biotin carboxyl carrier protein
MSDDNIPLIPEDVALIVAALESAGLERLDLATPRFTLRVARTAGGWAQEWSHADLRTPITAPAGEATGPEVAQIPEGLIAIRAPIPGTFYTTPQPGAPPFLKVGDTVGPDQVIGIIETMKVMNSVLAGVSGRVTELCVPAGVVVTQGQVLVLVEPVGV